jgi:hypothetical protein
MAESRVILVGVKETIDALKEFDKKAVSQFRKVINTELRQAENDAKQIAISASVHGENGGAPMSGWKTTPAKNPRRRKGNKDDKGFPAWDVNAVVSGISSSKAKGKVRADYTTSAGALINASAAGRIFELAGRKKGKSSLSDKSGSGEQFKRTLSNRFEKASRLIWRIVDRDKAKIEKNVEQAYEVAKATLQRELEKQHTK